MNAPKSLAASAQRSVEAQWTRCRPLTCSVLPVGLACNCACSFCFSKSSLSALQREHVDWAAMDVEGYYRFARARGATRVVITGGGEPLLRPDDVLSLVRRAAPFFGEIALFTNGSRLDRALACALVDAGLSYLCFSRHHHDDARNRGLMGEAAPVLGALFEAAGDLPIRATCVMARGFVDNEDEVWAYVDALRGYGVREFTFKHTYVAYEQSIFRSSAADRWARAHQVERDPFEGLGHVVGRLPWGPTIRRIRRGEELQLCYYREPTPAWELKHGIARSLNLMADGSVYASLEDARSRLFRLPECPPL